jgi:hypothetical protein
VATIFFWALVPETKGTSLEEIERHWMAKPFHGARQNTERELPENNANRHRKGNDR